MLPGWEPGKEQRRKKSALATGCICCQEEEEWFQWLAANAARERTRQVAEEEEECSQSLAANAASETTRREEENKDQRLCHQRLNVVWYHARSIPRQIVSSCFFPLHKEVCLHSCTNSLTSSLLEREVVNALLAFQHGFSVWHHAFTLSHVSCFHAQLAIQGLPPHLRSNGSAYSGIVTACLQQLHCLNSSTKFTSVWLITPHSTLPFLVETYKITPGKLRVHLHWLL